MHFPTELIGYHQWCVASPDGAPINPKTGKLAKPNDPKTWGTFEEARRWDKPIGFVLCDKDPFCVIDLDDKDYNPCSQEEKERHRKIIEAFNTYTEVSRSGRGYHIVLKGSLSGGRKRGHTEVYGSGRFIILTGNSNNLPVEDRQEWLDKLVLEMGPSLTATDLSESDEIMSDADVVEMALHAENAAKFDKLTRGDWQNDYNSQSEADQALLAMLAFYSQSNEQVRRIFRCSPLGQREKATRDNRYLDTNLRKLRGMEAPEVDLSKIEIPQPLKNTSKMPPKHEKESPSISALPPGFAGELAKYFLSVSIRPVPEIATAAALGLLAGITGRAYNISGAGLNQYILLLAKTGTGKEGMQHAIDRLLASIRLTVPIVDDYIGPATFASGPAVIKTLGKHASIVSILGEFGLTLQHLSNPANPTGGILKKVLLDVYGKSGANQVLRSSVYSDSEKNTTTVTSPALTILCESTPETFFEGLSQTHIAEGLIPRFLTIHYNGPRPAANPDPNQIAPEAITRRMVEIVAASASLSQTYQTKKVATDAEAVPLLEALDREADNAINAAKQDAEAQLWNRTHLKALKLAALIAVADSTDNPTITKATAEWAIAAVRKDLDMMMEKFSTGDVGTGDTKQLADLRRTIQAYFTTDEKTLQTSYALPPGLRDKGLIPYLYFQRRTSSLSSYRTDRLGATTALKRALESLISSGEIVELPRSQGQAFGYCGRTFAIPK